METLSLSKINNWQAKTFVDLIVGGYQTNVGRRKQQAWRPLADKPRQEATDDLFRQLLARGHALSHRRVFRRRLANCKIFASFENNNFMLLRCCNS